MLGRILVVFGSLALLHAAYLAWEARVQAKVGGYELERVWGTPVPANVALEAFAGFANLVLGVLATAPALKGVSFASEMSSRTIDAADAGLGMANLRHRGAVLFANEPPSKSS
ncbi:hypothetical protein JCM8202_001738 [Rhodotorula sphaerocarpa]